jgi:HSP20 family protein
MTIRDLISKNNLPGRRGEEVSPFMALHREVNRLFDEASRGFEMAPFGQNAIGRGMSWPHVELSETDKEVKVVAELPGLDEKDVQVELANGVLVIKGEKKTETDDKDLMFSERFYGQFERRIPVEDVEEAKVVASFKNGVLRVTLPKSARAQEKVKRIAINNK